VATADGTIMVVDQNAAAALALAQFGLPARARPRRGDADPTE
jgi:hypothetical protein